MVQELKEQETEISELQANIKSQTSLLDEQSVTLTEMENKIVGEGFDSLDHLIEEMQTKSQDMLVAKDTIKQLEAQLARKVLDLSPYGLDKVCLGLVAKHVTWDNITVLDLHEAVMTKDEIIGLLDILVEREIAGKLGTLNEIMLNGSAMTQQAIEAVNAHMANSPLPAKIRIDWGI